MTACSLTKLCLWFLPGIVFSVLLMASMETLANSGLELVNLARTKNGLTPLKVHNQLEKAAKGHVHYMAVNQQSGHVQVSGKKGFTGEDCIERIAAAGYPARKCSENISYGEPQWVESAEHLLSAIYHRMGFLSFDFDEVGMAVERSAVKPNTAEEPLYYAYVMGSSPHRKMCSQNTVSSGFYGMCRDKGLTVTESQYKTAEIQLAKNNAGLVIYPWSGQISVPPAFENNEAPNPWPGLEITGQPISAQFNFQHFKSKVVTVESFELRDQENNNVPLLPQRDKASDSFNGRFTEFQFAWFPERPLKWGTTYKASFRYKVNGKTYNKEWSFQTKAQPYSRQLVVSRPGQKFEIKASVEYAIVLAPELSHSRILGAHLEGCQGDHCILKIRDINVITITQKGSTTLTLKLSDGTKYSIFFSAR